MGVYAQLVAGRGVGYRRYIVSTLEASETMLEEVEPDSDAKELRIELMAAAINAVAAMSGCTKEKFMEMAKDAAEEYPDEDNEDDA